MKVFFILIITTAISTTLFAQDFTPYPERHMRLVQGISFSEDGNTMYFTLPHSEYRQATGVGEEGDPRLSIYYASFNGSTWDPPMLVSFSGKYKDYEPTLSSGGDVLFFNSNRPTSGSKELEKNDIWYSTRRNGQWEEPKPLKKLNNAATEESYATISKDGDLYYVAEEVLQGKSIYGIYSTKFKGGKTKPGEKLKLVEDPFEIGDPFISPEGDYLIFTRFDPSNWTGTCDLFISYKQEGSWSEPASLTELNGEGPDFSPMVSPDGKWLYYRKNYVFVKVPFADLVKKYVP